MSTYFSNALKILVLFNQKLSAWRSKVSVLVLVLSHLCAHIVCSAPLTEKKSLIFTLNMFHRKFNKSHFKAHWRRASLTFIMWNEMVQPLHKDKKKQKTFSDRHESSWKLFCCQWWIQFLLLKFWEWWVHSQGLVFKRWSKKIFLYNSLNVLHFKSPFAIV